MIVITATLAAKPGKWEEAKAAAAGLRTSARAGTAATVYNFFVDEAAEQLHVVEVYESPEKMQEHIDNTDFGEFGAVIEALEIEFHGEAPAEITDFVKTWAPVAFYTEL